MLCTLTGAYSVHLKWTEPRQPNGLISYYRVVYKKHQQDPTLNSTTITALTVKVNTHTPTHTQIEYWEHTFVCKECLIPDLSLILATVPVNVHVYSIVYIHNKPCVYACVCLLSFTMHMKKFRLDLWCRYHLFARHTNIHTLAIVYYATWPIPQVHTRPHALT